MISFGLVAARWIHFAAIFALFGSSLFWLLLGGKARTGLPHAWRATQMLLGTAAVIAAVSGVAWLGEILVNMTGGFSQAVQPQSLHAFFLAPPFGPVASLRLLLLALGLCVIALPPGARFGAWLLVGAALLVDQAWLGHAADGATPSATAQRITAYAVHVLAAAAWVGGLPALLLMLAMPRTAAKNPPDEIAILSRYSAMAAPAVILMLASGIINALDRLGGAPAGLYKSFYGRTLLAKLVLVAAMLAFATYHRLIVLPRLRTARQSLASSRLIRSIGAELMLGVLVIAAAALLGILPPPD